MSKQCSKFFKYLNMLLKRRNQNSEVIFTKAGNQQKLETLCQELSSPLPHTSASNNIQAYLRGVADFIPDRPLQ